MKEKSPRLLEIAESLFIVNRHAKTAPDPRQLYELKKQTVSKLLKEKKAKKIGLHYSNHPRLSQQHSTLLIEVAGYYFHIPAEKKDFDELQHLGKVDTSYRNPKPQRSLSKSKRTLQQYLGRHSSQPSRVSTYGSMLGNQRVVPWNQRVRR
ncbi:YkyB family protein [Salimicrobium halophilum]|uniref:YkyB-like protein n=1 Tax=Salimicrobium halophilum TaxID=86666 RepID=A0A1G8RNV0_9BACI|nr:YkyB family protein [Salimicrobium halophilum]SDJ18661.1 YkyB-like protein [Salimicrobium halophilum]